jgi:hypothetical protein
VFDFDNVMKDATNPDIMSPILEFGDHIHPNPFGYLRIGQAVDPSALQGAN